LIDVFGRNKGTFSSGGLCSVLGLKKKLHMEPMISLKDEKEKRSNQREKQSFIVNIQWGKNQGSNAGHLTFFFLSIF
jgi:hypothetical protein